MMRRETITVTVHTHVDPACVKYDGTDPVPRLLAWFFRCEECRR